MLSRYTHGYAAGMTCSQRPLLLPEHMQQIQTLLSLHVDSAARFQTDQQ